MIDNIVDSLGHADEVIQRRMVGSLTLKDGDLGMSVAAGLKH